MEILPSQANLEQTSMFIKMIIVSTVNFAQTRKEELARMLNEQLEELVVLAEAL